jgi:hypothetical protein
MRPPPSIALSFRASLGIPDQQQRFELRREQPAVKAANFTALSVYRVTDRYQPDILYN